MRVIKGAARRRAKKRLFRAARGYYGGRSRLYRTVKEAVVRAQVYSTAHRKQRQRNMRRLWIVRINAAARQRDMSYSRLIEGLQKAEIKLDRKVLAALAIEDPAAFDGVVDEAKQALQAARS